MGFRNRDTGVTPHTHRFCGAQVKVVFGQKNPAAIFAYEGMLMPKFAARLVHLCPAPRGDPHCRQADMIELGAKFLEPSGTLPTNGHNTINGTEHNGRRLAQARTPGCCNILACIRPRQTQLQMPAG
jgi:hypothetical protein